jgi:hypothetical protein
MSKPAPKAAMPVSTPPPSAAWRPDLRWHLKVLGGIYLVLIVVYVLVTAVLSRAKPPYGLRDIPKEVTPWLKK